MVDTTLTKTSTDNTCLTSSDIPRHDLDIELNNYYINYIDDLTDQSELKTFEINENKTSCQLAISDLPEEVIKFLFKSNKRKNKTLYRFFLMKIFNVNLNVFFMNLIPK